MSSNYCYDITEAGQTTHLTHHQLLLHEYQLLSVRSSTTDRRTAVTDSSQLRTHLSIKTSQVNRTIFIPKSRIGPTEPALWRNTGLVIRHHGWRSQIKQDQRTQCLRSYKWPTGDATSVSVDASIWQRLHLRESTTPIRRPTQRHDINTRESVATDVTHWLITCYVTSTVSSTSKTR